MPPTESSLSAHYPIRSEYPKAQRSKRNETAYPRPAMTFDAKNSIQTVCGYVK